MKIPDDRKYTKDHEWVRMRDGVAECGITEFAQSELGEIVFAELPAAGRSVKRGESFCVVESTKAASDVYAPIGGRVAAANAALSSTPDLINKDPYEQGWMVRLDSVNEGDLAELMSAEQYRAHLG